MGLTVTAGDPVLCIWILAYPSLSATDVKLSYYRTSIPYYSSKTMEENMEDFQALYGLPVYKFRVKIDSRLNVHFHWRIN